MSTKDRKEPLFERVADKLLVGSGRREPFLIRHDWAIPACVFAGCGVFTDIVLVASLRGRGPVYAFRDPELADSVVFLTEAHDEVWRSGWKLDGVRIGGEGGPVKPGPGSPFLRDGSKWEFTS